eukprot:m.337471 g.337471  ORF g.337471 m.337471 type:complete len:415 (-) comp20552_c0_seq2:410-1654(-)
MDFLLCASNEGALLVFYVLFHWKHTGPCPATPTYSHVGFVTNLIAHQYAVALLMNLCLRSAGRAFCVTACPGVVPLLKDMLIHEENAQVRSYIHGALYSLLGNATMREAALSVGIDKVVKQRLAESDEEMSMQLEYILRLMRETDDAAVDADGSVSDDEDDVDDVDDESDDLTACDESEGETLVVPPGSATRVGEQLLCTEYLASGSTRSSVDAAHAADVAPSTAAPPPPPATTLPVLFRPSTPTLRPTATPTTGVVPPRSAHSRGRTGDAGGGNARTSTRPPPSGSGRPPSSRRSTAAGSRNRPRSGLASSRGSSRVDNAPSRGGTGRGTNSRDGRRGNADNGAISDDNDDTVERSPQPPPKVKSPPPPSQKVLDAVAKDLGKAGKGTAVDMGEYNNIFSTRPKVPRTPNGHQ